MMPDLRTLLDLLALVLTPVFAAGGAWVSINWLREDVRGLKRDVRRMDARVVNLYGHLRVPLPVEREDSVS